MGGKTGDTPLQILARSRHKESVAEPEEQWPACCVDLSRKTTMNPELEVKSNVKYHKNSAHYLSQETLMLSSWPEGKPLIYG